ncbi:MAG: ROK family protein [Bacteroidales bacterium]|jgi:glucokinase|nr:ROK family protein [Bacteroidales bacterium]
MICIGVDLGGTKVSGALFNMNNSILLRETLLLEGKGGEEVGELICKVCEAVLEKGGHKSDDIKCIGVCVPGISYSKTGTVWCPNIPGWDNYPLKRELEKRFPNSNITIESDRTAYILGEVSLGAAKGCDNAIFIAVGTGIGAGILIDGRVLHGASDIVGATGWMALKPPYTSEWDACGCFESHASGTGIAMQACKKVRSLKSSGCGDGGVLLSMSPETISSKDVFEAYDKGDLLAISVIDEAIEMWGMAAANFVSLFNPQMVIFGGGLFGPASRFIDRIYAEAVKWAQPIAIKQCTFNVTQLPNDAGLYGAGAIAIKNGKE